MRHSLSIALLSLCGAVACNDDSPKPTSPPPAPVDELLDDDPTGGLDGKTDNTASRARRIQVLGRLTLDAGEWVSVSTPEGIATAYTFHAPAGMTLSLSAEGASALRVYAPRPVGNDWGEPIWAHLSDTPEGDPEVLDVVLDEAGLYAVEVVPEAGHTPKLTARCSSVQCTRPSWPLPTVEGALSLTAVGDLGLTVSRAPIDSEGGYKYGEFHYWHEMLEGFDHFINADLNLVNLETAVTTRGEAAEKTYTFRMPAEALEATLDAGFNVMSLANNHTGDYGAIGVEDTLEHLKQAAEQRPLLAWAGAGMTFDDAVAPRIFEHEGVTVALSSIGIGRGARWSGGVGVAHIYDDDAAIERLMAAEADIHILAVHGGTERKLEPTAQIQGIAHKAVDAGVDLVWGHHPHVTQGIERRGEGLIMYSLGNYALRGARNMGTLAVDLDYGLAVRLMYDREAKRFSRLEAAPIFDMHRVVRPLRTVERTAERIRRLNNRGEALGEGGMKFEIDEATGMGWVEL
ncbi:MAG: CapA family protein [Bradymonadia bacterium]